MLKTPLIKAAAVLGFLAFGTISVAGEGDEKEGKVVKLPPAVARSLKAKYPGAQIRGISKEKDAEGETIYEVELTVPTKVDVNFDEEGEPEVIEREIGQFELPEVIRKVAAKTFPKGKILKAETLLEEEGELKYEVVIELKGKKPFEVIMAGNGKILENGATASDEHKANKGEDEEEDDDKQEAKAKKGEKAEHKHKAKKSEDDDDDKQEAKAKKGEKAEHKHKAKKGEKAEHKHKAKKGEDDDDE
jgi:hypothetical protein